MSLFNLFICCTSSNFFFGCFSTVLAFPAFLFAFSVFPARYAMQGFHRAITPRSKLQTSSDDVFLHFIEVQSTWFKGVIFRCVSVRLHQLHMAGRQFTPRSRLTGSRPDRHFTNSKSDRRECPSAKG